MYTCDACEFLSSFLNNAVILPIFSSPGKYLDVSEVLNNKYRRWSTMSATSYKIAGVLDQNLPGTLDHQALLTVFSLNIEEISFGQLQQFLFQFPCQNLVVCAAVEGMGCSLL